jgi:hypothetical protein
MNRSFPGNRIAIAAVLGLLLASGCAKKMSVTDPNFTQLEGRTDPRSILMVYPEYSPSASTWLDLGDHGVGIPGSPGYGVDVKVDTTVGHATGTLHLMLIDGTDASQFELYRSAKNGGLQRVGDFLLNSNRKWLDSGWEIYETTVATPSGYTPTYVARGLISGVAGTNSPLTNVTTPAPINFTPTIAFNDSMTPADSLFRMTWTPAPGAAGYWVQVYEFNGFATNDEKRASGEPAPVWNGHVNNYFVGYVAAPATTYTLGGPGATVFKFVPPVRNKTYRVRITAVDATSKVIAYMHGYDFLDDGLLFNGDNTEYDRFPMASVTVTPKIKGHSFFHDFGE